MTLFRPQFFRRNYTRTHANIFNVTLPRALTAIQYSSNTPYRDLLFMEPPITNTASQVIHSLPLNNMSQHQLSWLAASYTRQITLHHTKQCKGQSSFLTVDYQHTTCNFLLSDPQEITKIQFTHFKRYSQPAQLHQHLLLGGCVCPVHNAHHHGNQYTARSQYDGKYEMMCTNPPSSSQLSTHNSTVNVFGRNEKLTSTEETVEA